MKYGDATSRDALILPVYHEPSAQVVSLLSAINSFCIQDLVIYVAGKALSEDDVKLYSALPNVCVDNTANEDLSTQLLRMIGKIESERIAVMDSDFQHPPSVLPELFASMYTAQYFDFVVAKRRKYNMSRYRLFISHFFSCLIKLRLCRYYQVDVLSGFFVFRKTTVAYNKAVPMRFKILLSLLRTNSKYRVGSILFDMQRRTSGVSKANYKEALRLAKYIVLGK